MNENWRTKYGLTKPKETSKPQMTPNPHYRPTVATPAKPVQKKEADRILPGKTIRNDPKLDVATSEVETKPISKDENRPPKQSVMTPADLNMPAFLMAPPITFSVKNPNNIWMKENNEPIDLGLALKQWHDLYSFLVSAGSLVYLLPNGGDYQDQVFVANLFLVLHHLKKPTVVLSNYASEPRQGEEDVGDSFFKTWNLYNTPKYDIVKAKYLWEGEAETKWLHDNVYIGGYGTAKWSRTDLKVYDWFEGQFDMKVVRVNMRDEHLYHLDTLVFPISSEKTMVCTDIITPEEIKEIEKETEIIPVTKADAHEGITNCVRVHNSILVATDLKSLKENTKEFKDEREMVENLEHICVNEGFELVPLDLAELGKGGSALSCNVAHMNAFSLSEELL
jgi:N-dimethylarginine dimethylaminohydrolase